ncbi:hypothetical protein B0813_001745 [Candidatus Fervidibacteria bacterium JGI MDM2 SSWTFF-3-K9]
MLSQERVELEDGRVLVQLLIDDPEVVDWVSKVGGSGDERIDAIKRALKVGVTAMTSALVGSTSLTLQQTLERWRAEVERALSESRERITQTITEHFGQQVAQPVRDQIEQATRNAEERIREHIDRLERRIDPNDPRSWLGIVQETVNAIKQEFDPERENSYLWKVRRTLSEFYGRDGEAAQCIKETIRQTLEPVQSMVEQIRGDILRIMERLGGMTPEKGKAFEVSAVAELLHKATSVTGDTCDHVGKDNKPGDWLITVHYGSVLNRQQIGKIVIEAKDTNRNRSQVDDDLNRAMTQRNADVGILIFARPDQNPYELPFAVLDENCSKLVCVWDEQGLNFNFAYQLARLQILENYLRSAAQVDWASLRRQIHEIINEAEQMDDIANKARLAKERAQEAENLSREIKRSLIQRLQALEREISRQVQ